MYVATYEKSSQVIWNALPHIVYHGLVCYSYHYDFKVSSNNVVDIHLDFLKNLKGIKK